MGMEYVTGQERECGQRVFSNLQDAVVHFGFRPLLPGGVRARHRTVPPTA